MFDLIIRGGTVVTPKGAEQLDVAVRDGRIVELGSFATAASKESFDAKGLHVLPGVIDSQCHFREPGLTHKEDIGSGSASAALGGVTCFFEMPNTQPSTDSLERLQWKLDRARETAWVDYAFYVGATRDNIGELRAMTQVEGCVGVKMFLGSSTGSLLVDDPQTQLRVLQSGARGFSCHSEDEARLVARKPMFKPGDVHSHPEWRDELCAVESTQRILGLARQAKRRIHILHVTTAGEVPLLAAHRDVATFEVTPQHLTLWAPDCYDRLGTLAQMNPPIRTKQHHDALWRAVNEGLVDVLGSDHAPHSLEEKAKPWPTSPSGMPGVQTLVPVMLNHVAAGRLSLMRFVELTSHGAARVFGMKGKGGVVVGNDADFTVVDLRAERVITNAWSKSRCGWTPFDGMKVTGWPMATLVRGQCVMRDGALIGSPSAKAVRFEPRAV